MVLRKIVSFALSYAGIAPKRGKKSKYPEKYLSFRFVHQRPGRDKEQVCPKYTFKAFFSLLFHGILHEK